MAKLFKHQTRPQTRMKTEKEKKNSAEKEPNKPTSP